MPCSTRFLIASALSAVGVAACASSRWRVGASKPSQMRRYTGSLHRAERCTGGGASAARSEEEEETESPGVAGVAGAEAAGAEAAGAGLRKEGRGA